MSFKKTITAMALALGISTPSIADGGDFTGFYAGAQLGYGSGHVKSNNNESGTNNQRLDYGLSGMLYGLQMGYLYQLGMLVLGAEFAYNHSNIDSTAHDGDTRAKLRRLHTFLAAARIACVINSWMAYTMLGWQNTGFRLQTSGHADHQYNFSKTKRSNAFMLAFGVETLIAAHFLIGLQWSKAFHKKLRFPVGTRRDSFQPRTNEFTIRASYKF